MTKDDFYAALAEQTRRTGTTWIVERGYLRAGYGLGCHCPLSFVAGTRACDVSAAQHVLGLSRAAIIRIADAADNDACFGEERRRLLHACGLEG